MNTADQEIITPKFWYNIVPDLSRHFNLDLPPLLDPTTNQTMQWQDLAKTLPSELAKQELNTGIYEGCTNVSIPDEVFDLYKTFRHTPLVRALGLERELGLKHVRIYFKDEGANPIGSYKLNSSIPQAYYAKIQGVNEFIGDTGPGNWGMGMAFACREFNIPATIYMEKSNYDKKAGKVRAMTGFGATVTPISTEEGTIAASLNVALDHVNKNPDNRLSLGCLTAYSALHNTIIGLELKNQLKAEKITPDVMIGVVGGGSSFSGFTFPFLKDYTETDFVAVESCSVPSFTKGEYRYENPDLLGLMPKAKMYTLGANFVPEQLGASGLNYHGKNPILSLLIKNDFIRAIAYEYKDVEPLQSIFERVQGIKPATESCFAIKSACDIAQKMDSENTEEQKTVVFLLSGHANAPEL